MPSFEDLFSESSGQPVVYNGKTLTLLDRFQITNGALLKLTFEKFGSPWRQGVILRTDGTFEINDQVIKKSIVLWQDTAPLVQLFRVRSKKGVVQIHNVWDPGDGGMQNWHNGAAMITEDIPSGRRYHCNDGHPDDNFDDVVFRLECV